MKTPYETRQIERIIASAIARRFAGAVSEKQGQEMIEAQRAVMDAQSNFRQLVDSVVQDIMR